jgi:separase
LEKIFRQAIAAGHGRGKTPRIKLDDHIVQCFATLSSKAREQEFEDLVYFILDLHQFYGVPVALAELDIDQVSSSETAERDRA